MSRKQIKMTPGMNRNTVSRLMPTPLASALPRSEPMPKRMKRRAMKPMTVVRPLDRMEEVDLHSASFMAALGSGFSFRHSLNRWMRKTE